MRTYPSIHSHAVLEWSRPFAFRRKPIIDADDNDLCALGDYTVDRIVHLDITKYPASTMCCSEGMSVCIDTESNCLRETDSKDR